MEKLLIHGKFFVIIQTPNHKNYLLGNIKGIPIHPCLGSPKPRISSRVFYIFKSIEVGFPRPIGGLFPDIQTLFNHWPRIVATFCFQQLKTLYEFERLHVYSSAKLIVHSVMEGERKEPVPQPFLFNINLPD